MAFPLQAIGPIRGAFRRECGYQFQPLSMVDFQGSSSTREDVVVLGERRGSGTSLPLIPCGQPLFGDISLAHSTRSGDSLGFSIHTVVPTEIYRLINRAIHWLLNDAMDNRYHPMSPLVYWAIRSLPIFYSDIITEAQRQGAPPLIELHEEEWLEPPDEEENFEGSGYPDWLVFILTLDNVNEWRLEAQHYGTFRIDST